MIRRYRAVSFIARVLRADTQQSESLPPLESVDWTATLAVANEHLLVPELRAALERTGHLSAVPPEVRRYLNLLYRLNRYRNRAVRRQILELIRALNDAGIEPMLLKGALTLVACRPTGFPSRMMADIDVMVHRGQRDSAICALHGLGYTVRDRYPDGHHAFGEFGRDGSPASLDLHFELVDQADILPAAEVWRRAVRFEPGQGLSCFVPSPTDRIFHHLLHAQIHHLGAFYRGVVHLRQLHEFSTLARDPSAVVDWVFIRDRMRRFRLLTPLYSYVCVAGALFGMKSPLPNRMPARAGVHAARCILTVSAPAVRHIAVPWGNLRAAFAAHRMERLYRSSGVPRVLWRIHHLRQVLWRHPIAFPLYRLFRS